MIDTAQLEPLRQRRAHVQKRYSDLGNRIAKLEHQRSLLEQELAALGTTLETLGRVYGIDPNAEPDIPAGKSTGGNSTKPDDTPTLYEMASIIFSDWDLMSDLHEAQDIYDEIKRRWWPDAPRNSIIPSLWRFAQEGRIRKEGTLYGPLRKEKAPGVAAPSAPMEEDFDDEIPF